ncbi:hypothetical protein Q5752_003596 [Cryptotrichosporon argae]
MFRPSTLRPLASRAAAARRFASSVPETTRAPTTSSTRAGELSTVLAPGEEVDPQLHGYPQLPYVSLQTREPFGWWDRQERKNFGEVFHEEEDVLGMWGPDVHKTSGPSALAQLSGAFALIGVFSYLLYKTRPQRPVAARTYPYGGLEKELGDKLPARVEKEDE